MVGRLQHVRWASTAVKWRPWSAETLALARQANKPVFLCSGHHASHLCRVMDAESFGNADIARLLNAEYVAVRIDKERHAGVDAAMMLNLQAQTDGQGGWPLNVFLAPTSLRPFVAGNYWSRADLALILGRAAEEWRSKQALCEEFADARARALEQAMHLGPHAGPVDPEVVLQGAREEYVDVGRAGGPRFPMGYSLALLGGEVLAATLHVVARSGTVDQLEGGVHRYAVSADWHLPCFEKTLRDQATLLVACVKYLETHAQDAEIRALALGLVNTMQYLQGRSAVDGDDPVTGAEGGCYLWTADQFHRALQLGQMGLIERDMAEMYYGVNTNGNVNKELDTRGELYGKNVLSQYNSVAKVAEAFGQPAGNVEKVVAEATRLLREFRAKTMPPHTLDTNDVVAWNGLAMAALARTAAVVPEWRDRTLDMARETAFRLLHAFGYGALSRTLDRDTPACCDDYAYLVHGLLELYAVEKNPEWLRWAAALQTHQIELFTDRKEGGFFYTQEDATLYIRPKFGHDGAEPSYNGVSAQNLIRLANLTGVGELRDVSQRTIDCYKAGLAAQPLAFLSTLDAIKTLRI